MPFYKGRRKARVSKYTIGINAEIGRIKELLKRYVHEKLLTLNWII